MYDLTIFKSVFDNKTNKKLTFETWGELETLLYRLSGQPGEKPAKGDRKQGTALISPAVYRDNTTRANRNVVCWGRWAALDIDNYEGEFDKIVESFGPYYYVCYSTASSTESFPKFRLVFPLTDSVESDKIPHFWSALNKEFLQLGDIQTKDLARIFYAPADYPGAFNFIFTHKGEFINPKQLMSKHVYVPNRASTYFDSLPEAMQEQILAERAAKLTNTSISWTTHKDCPFVSQKVVNDYLAAVNVDTGKYHGMYRFMVSIAGNALRNKYPITAKEIATLCRELDAENGNHYAARPLETEAQRAIDYIYRTEAF